MRLRTCSGVVSGPVRRGSSSNSRLAPPSATRRRLAACHSAGVQAGRLKLVTMSTRLPAEEGEASPACQWSMTPGGVAAGEAAAMRGSHPGCPATMAECGRLPQPVRQTERDFSSQLAATSAKSRRSAQTPAECCGAADGTPADVPPRKAERPLRSLREGGVQPVACWTSKCPDALQRLVRARPRDGRALQLGGSWRRWTRSRRWLLRRWHPGSSSRAHRPKRRHREAGCNPSSDSR
jgi:hypothetical protein